MVEEGSTIVSVREEHGAKRDIKTLRRFQFTLDGGLCKKCNNERLGGLVQVVQPILEPMAVRCEPDRRMFAVGVRSATARHL
jgi:hypothetical protein